MSKIRDAQGFFSDAQVIVTVENTYRPALNGARRRVTHVGKSFFEGVLLDSSSDGKSEAGQPFRGIIPTRAGDVIRVTDTEATFRLGMLGTPRGEHHVTYRKEASLQATQGQKGLSEG
jgi:hypothetical protein